MRESQQGPDVPTKDRILKAAVEQFAERGYNGASLRAIAAQADADLALIAYYFGNKAGLFLTIVDQTLAPATRLTEPWDLTLDELSVSVLNWLFDLFEESEDRHALIAVLRTVLTPTYPEDAVHAEVVQRLREMLVRVCGGPDGPRPAYAFVGTVVGMMAMRYVTPIEPISSVPRDEIVKILAPRLRALLDDHGWMVK